MAIITISRGSFSGGKMLAECLARKLNYRCIDRDVIAQRASIRTISPDEILAALESPPANTLGTLNHRKYVYLALIQAAIVEEIGAGNAVYHGLAGHLLLQGGLALLRLRVIAPLEFRVQEAQARMKMSREEALAHIEKVDAHRSRWTRYLYGVDWEDPSLYDLIINLQHITVEQACRLVVGMVKEGAFEADAKKQALWNDFVIATRVRAALARDPMTSNLELDVVSQGGNVTIKGDLCEEHEEVQRVAQSVPGAHAVHFQEAELPRAA